MPFLTLPQGHVSGNLHPVICAILLQKSATVNGNSAGKSQVYTGGNTGQIAPQLMPLIPIRDGSTVEIWRSKLLARTTAAIA